MRASTFCILIASSFSRWIWFVFSAFDCTLSVMARRPSASNTSCGSRSFTGTIARAVIDTFSSVRPFFLSSSLSALWMCSANSLRLPCRSMNVWFAATLRSASVSLPSRIRSLNIWAAE